MRPILIPISNSSDVKDTNKNERLSYLYKKHVFLLRKVAFHTFLSDLQNEIDFFGATFLQFTK